METVLINSPLSGGVATHHTTSEDRMGADQGITPHHRVKAQREQTTKVQETKPDQCGRICTEDLDQDSAGDHLVRDSPEKREMRKTKRIRVKEPRVSSHLNAGTAATSTTDADAQKILNHKMVKRPRQPKHQQKTRPLPRLSRAGLSKIPAYHLYHHPVLSSKSQD